MEELSRLPQTALAIVLLIAVAAIVLTAFGVERPQEAGVAVLRAAIQLTLLSLVLASIITNPVWIGIALVVMFGAGVVVATRRAGFAPRTMANLAISMASGAGIALTIVFSTGTLELSPRYALSLGAIVIGNSMSIATLSSRNLNRLLYDRWGEVEAWLALGASPWLSTVDLAREAVRESLIPSIDQTKTTGLVVLPGSFVGAVFGGLSPIEAGRFQLVVLASVLAAGSVTATMLVYLIGRNPALRRNTRR